MMKRTTVCRFCAKKYGIIKYDSKGKTYVYLSDFTLPIGLDNYSDKPICLDCRNDVIRFVDLMRYSLKNKRFKEWLSHWANLDYYEVESNKINAWGRGYQQACRDIYDRLFIRESVKECK